MFNQYASVWVTHTTSNLLCSPGEGHSVVTYVVTELSHLFMNFDPNTWVRAAQVRICSCGETSLKHLLYDHHQVDLLMQRRGRKQQLQSKVRMMMMRGRWLVAVS